MVPALPTDVGVWRAAWDLPSRARRAGKTVPASDILFCACARRHGIPIEHADAQFDMVAEL